MGSISAWLPSRRSTLAQRGARVNRRSAQVRSWSTSGTCERYLSKGIGDGSQGRARRPRSPPPSPPPPPPFCFFLLFFFFFFFSFFPPPPAPPPPKKKPPWPFGAG